jgi:small-conductance mechanosensitive channel
MSALTTQIIIFIACLLVTLTVGLFLRYLLVRHLKRTILDNWLIQILGVLIIIPPIIVGIIVAAAIIGIPATDMLLYLSLVLPDIFNKQSFGQVIWNLALSVLIFLVAIGVGRTFLKVITAGTAKERLGVNATVLLGRCIYIVDLFVAFLFILAVWNIQFGIPAAVISVITVGLTFVFQDLLKNIVAGVYILVEGPFHIGDTITTDVYTGKVEDVQLRATKLRIVSGEQVIVPNSLLFTGVVINRTIYEEKRATVLITMPLDKYDTEQTFDNILKAMKDVTGVMLKPEPTVSLSTVAGAFGSSTGTVSGYTGEIISLLLRFWISDGDAKIISEVMVSLRQALPYADLSIREPTGL